MHLHLRLLARTQLALCSAVQAYHTKRDTQSGIAAHSTYAQNLTQLLFLLLLHNKVVAGVHLRVQH
jgi:hypothetical protein